MLCYNPEKRVCASEALKHPYFNGKTSIFRSFNGFIERPLPIEPRMMPTFPEYRNSRRQTDRKESRKEKEDPTRRKAQPGPISVTLDS